MAENESRAVSPVYTLADLFEQADKDADARHRARQEGRHLGPVTGFVQIDRALGGILEQGIHIVHGAPGVGKTAFALNVAQACGCSAMMITCEMAALTLLKRLTANLTSTYLGRLSSGEYEPARLRALYMQAAAAAPDIRILDATRGLITRERVEECAEGATSSTGKQLLLIVDSLHSLADRIAADFQEYEALNRTLAWLRDLSSATGAPILTISERNRASMEGGGLSAGAGSRRIEYGSESVLDLTREKDKDGKPIPPDYDEWVKIAGKLDKNRHGATGAKINLEFSGRLQRYRETIGA